MITERKTCAECHTDKPTRYFAHDPSGNDPSTRCVHCVRKQARRAALPEKQRAAYLRRKYGMTVPAYNAQLASQGGGCAVCGKPPETNGRALAVDHDHACCPGKTTCGKCIRGLLCTNCNQGLGQFADDAERLIRAAEYLRAKRK